MKVLIACEESQVVCKAFRKKGHEAFSADIVDCSGGKPEWHLKGDVLQIIDDGWDLIIAHPPCTFLSVSGNRWMRPEYAERFPNRAQERQEAIEFFLRFAEAKCDKIAIENPVGIMSTEWKKPTQYVEPFYFGDPHKKKTGLWLKGLPALVPTNIVEPSIIFVGGKNHPTWHYESMGLVAEERRKVRSRTFEGFAKAMADQWG